ncbi:allantoinase, mitochondrial-like isoform X5 [Notamacropus eugenii]|uniref:allantoinase, mitochondrial-like isoform X5 n=1 Tax=Notamacropus eugenii TaxID=9315 RepID=UPI003B66F245
MEPQGTAIGTRGPAGMEVGSQVTVIRSTQVVMKDAIIQADVVITGGQITDILPVGSRVQRPGDKVLDVGDLVVMPGIIDSHVHINEPGRTAWEGFYSATRAAAAGGITTLVDMPLNCQPPTTTLINLHTKLRAARTQCHVDVAFWGGLIPGNTVELKPMREAGVPGFKCFMIDSGVEEFPHVSIKDLHMAMRELQGTDCVLLNQLWMALQEGDIDLVISDHSPCTEDLKNLESGDFLQAWGGISSLQFGLPLFWTSARLRGFSLHDVVKLMCKNPAILSGLDTQKGSLCPGQDADLVIWDPDKEFEVNETMIQHKNKKILQEGESLKHLGSSKVQRNEGFDCRRRRQSEGPGTCQEIVKRWHFFLGNGFGHFASVQQMSFVGPL